MRLYFTRRNFLTTGVGALVTAAELRAQSAQIARGEVPISGIQVALAGGADGRRRSPQERLPGLLAIDDQIRPKLKTKKRVLIKANDVGGGQKPTGLHSRRCAPWNAGLPGAALQGTDHHR